MRPYIILLVVVTTLLVQGCGRAADSPKNVLVVQNGDSPVSRRIAEYYLKKRNISKDYLVTIHTQDSSISASNESITPEDYAKKIQDPISEFLAEHELEDQIQYIVLTKGIPIKLTTDPLGGSTGPQSVDSLLATTDLKSPRPIRVGDGKGGIKCVLIVNPYWQSKERFSHEKFGGYLVTRLDGYTEADAKALVDRAIAPAPKERVILLDIDPKRGMGDITKQPKQIFNTDGTPTKDPEVKYGDFNADMLRLDEIISKRPGLQVEIDKTEELIAFPKPLLGYVSWGSNDGGFTKENYNKLKFTSRSLVETAVSSSGRTLLPTTGGQSLIADLITQGAAGGKGYVSEPFLMSMASPSLFLDYYTSGRNLAESYYAASRFIGWKDIVLGDPLCTLEDK